MKKYLIIGGIILAGVIATLLIGSFFLFFDKKEIVNIESEQIFGGTITLEENFDSYDDGDLNGQGGWSGNAVFDVQGTVVQAGAKAVSATAGGSVLDISKSISPSVASGSATIYMRASDTSNYSGRFDTKSSSLVVCNTRMASGQFQYYTTADSVWVNIAPYNIDTWYKVYCEWRISDGKVRYRINDTAGDSGWVDPYNAGWTAITSVALLAQRDTAYFDEITIINSTIIPPSVEDPPVIIIVD